MSCCFFLTVWPGRSGRIRDSPQEEAGERRERGAYLSSYCYQWGRWEELNVQHGARRRHHGEIGHEQCWENGPFLAWPKSATFSPPTIYLFILPRAGLCVSLSANTSAWPCGLFVCFSFFPTCPPFHHRSGISSLWSVWRYWLVTRARCCVCSMMRGSSSRARLTPLSGTRTV